MPMDGIVLNRIVSEMKKGLPFKINRITQPSKHEFIFNGFNGKSTQLLISTHPNTARLQWTKIKSEMNLQAPHMVTLFRKHLEAGNLVAIEQNGFDRVIKFTIENRDELGVMKTFHLYLELLGRFANLIFTDEADIIYDCVVRQNNFETQARILLPGVKYEISKRSDRKSPVDLTEDDIALDMYQYIEGFSPSLSKACVAAISSGTDFDTLKTDLLNSESLYIYEDDFHVVALSHLNQNATIKEIMPGLDYFYEQRSINERIGVYTDVINRQIRKELKREKRRLKNLQNDLDHAQNAEHLKAYGELLYTYAQDLPAGHTEITLTDFEGETVTVPLKEKINGIKNAQDYFKRYQKAKRSLHHLEREIEKSHINLEYYEQILVQTQHADLKDALEIREELMNANILKRQKVNPRKKKKTVNHRVLNLENAQILIGKNNTQNDHITFTVANKKDLWFHVANAPGSHVILKTDEASDDLIEIAASLAAYFSGNKHSKNIEVHYTQVKNIRKIPGAPKGMVSLQSFESIVVNAADASLLESLE